MMFLTNVLAPFFVGAFVSFAAMRLRLENQRAAHQAQVDAMVSTSVTPEQYAQAMQDHMDEMAEQRGAA